jgi:hypothetical protein
MMTGSFSSSRQALPSRLFARLRKQMFMRARLVRPAHMGPFWNSPSELRKLLSGPRTAAQPTLTRFLKARATPGVEAIEDDCYWRTIGLNGQAGEIEVRLVPDEPLLRALGEIVRSADQSRLILLKVSPYDQPQIDYVKRDDQISNSAVRRLTGISCATPIRETPFPSSTVSAVPTAAVEVSPAARCRKNLRARAGALRAAHS